MGTRARGDVIMGVLSVLSRAALDVPVLIETLLTAPYGSSLGRMKAVERSIRQRQARAAVERERAERYYSLLYKLKRDGLIEQRSKSGRSILAITSRGMEKLRVLRQRRSSANPTPDYTGEPNSRFVIVAFDVPETERRKRAWLRSALQNIGLHMVQKSVWIGKKKLPKEFLRDLADLRLLEYVEIFEITKTGSLRHIA